MTASFSRPFSMVLRFCAVVLLLIGLAAGRATAASGDLDPTFGGGTVVTDISGNDSVNAVVIQPDGKIIAAGGSTGAGTDFTLVRYLDTGAPDATFGTVGQVVTELSSGNDEITGIGLQSDGNIVVAGVTTVGGNTVFALARYLGTTGALDPAFGVGGIVTTQVGAGNATARALAIQDDDKIVVVGDAAGRFAIVRYTPGGALDTTFNGTGIVIKTVAGANNLAHAVLIQSDHKIIAVGEVDPGRSNDFALVRYNANGTIDTGFNGTGIVVTDLLGSNTNEFAYAAALQPDGKIVAAGAISTGASNFAVARYNANGTLDTGFGVGGHVVTSIGAGADEAHGLGIQPSGKIVVAGWSVQGTRANDFAVVRYLTDGSLDTTFGAGGIVVTTIQPTSDDLANAMALQPDNRIVVAGASDDGTASGFDFAAARYQSPNAPPAVTDVGKSGLEDTTVTFAANDFATQFTDADGDVLNKIMITSLPADGTLKLRGVAVALNQEIAAADLAHLTFVPAGDWNGATSCTWSASDGIDYAAADANLTITVAPVNDPPAFAPGADVTVLEDAGQQTLASWVTGIAAGPPDEAGQALAFTVTTDHDALFAALPTITPAGASGTLDFTLAADANGIATVTVTLKDDGGTANGGADTRVRTFTITVRAVNDAPSFVKGADQVRMAGSGAQTVPGWATGIAAGPANEGGQILTFLAATDNVPLFSALPAIDSATGTLSFAPAAGKWGSATVTVRLADNGGTTNGGIDTSALQTFTITFRPYRIPLPLIQRN